MDGLVRYFLEAKAVTYAVLALLTVGGFFSFFQLGQLEDPVFTVKTGVIVTQYPGASPKEVELEVTDRIEKAVQELPQLKSLYSFSRAGVSIIKVDIKAQYWADRLPQVWDEMRKKIRDITPQFPPGVGTPDVSDDFNFVYGFVLAVTGDGFTYRELEDYADAIKKELSVLTGIARVELWGVQNQAIYVDINERQLSERGLNAGAIAATLRFQNMVVDAGYVDAQGKRFRVAPSGSFTRPEEIGELVIRSSAGANALTRVTGQRSTELIRIRDIATVRRGYLEPPFTMMRFDGKPAIGIQIAALETANVVEVGKALDREIAALKSVTPVGMEMHKVAWQSDLVQESITAFLLNLAAAVTIVFVVLVIPSGLRMGAIIGIDLVLTILGTFIVMAIFDIPLQRMSLGALIIAMGMMVDNSIVVADGIAVKMRQGMDRKQAALESATGPSWPLLSATLVATLAFYPIFASSADTGEYCRALFTVVGTALVLSWFIALTLTPTQCVDMLPEPKPATEGADQADEFSRGIFALLRRVLGVAIRYRTITLTAMVVLLVISAASFTQVRQMFFPSSSRPQLMIDYWAPQGTRIQQVSADLKVLEEKIIADPRTSNVSTFIGSGPPRFYLPVDPEFPYSSYAELVINFDDFENIDSFIADFQPWARLNMPQALVRFRKYDVGVSETWKFEARFSGPAEADLDTLRRLGNEAMAIVKKSPFGREWRTDMRQRVKKVVPVYNQQRGRWAAVTREDLAQTTKRAYDGVPVGLYREGDDLLPILIRHTEEERTAALDRFDELQIQPAGSTVTVPLGQVVDAIKPQFEDPIIVRWNRRRAITVQGMPTLDATYPELRADVINEINAMKLPAGYQLFWDGEEASTNDAVNSLLPGMIPAVVVIFFLILTVFKAFRPVLIIACTIPFALIGVTWSLIALDTPFGFLALLGAMSLAGMMNKNIVVLLDSVNENLDAGLSPYDAIVESAVKRMRPVMLAAGTTILGIIPLVPDVFWTAMAVTIMGGLLFGSVLTLVIVPVLYCIFYKVKSPLPAAAAG